MQKVAIIFERISTERNQILFPPLTKSVVYGQILAFYY